MLTFNKESFVSSDLSTSCETHDYKVTKGFAIFFIAFYTIIRVYPLFADRYILPTLDREKHLNIRNYFEHDSVKDVIVKMTKSELIERVKRKRESKGAIGFDKMFRH